MILSRARKEGTVEWILRHWIETFNRCENNYMHSSVDRVNGFWWAHCMSHTNGDRNGDILRKVAEENSQEWCGGFSYIEFDIQVE